MIEKLSIEGYSLILPASWERHGIARVIMYVNDDLNYKRKNTAAKYEVGMGRDKKTTVQLYYREWTGGVSGDRSQESQRERLSRHIEQWKGLSGQNRDFVILGYCDLCAKSWNNQDYVHKHLAESVIDYLLEENVAQLVSGFTRVQMRGNVVEKSCLDHIYTNTPTKCTNVQIVPAGECDHMVVIVTK